MSSSPQVAPENPELVRGYVIANRALCHAGAPGQVLPGEFPRYLYREMPDEPADSGWRVFTGTETQADADEPSNFLLTAASTLVRAHPQLSEVLAAGRDGAWEWDDAIGRYAQAPAPDTLPK